MPQWCSLGGDGLCGGCVRFWLGAQKVSPVWESVRCFSREDSRIIQGRNWRGSPGGGVVWKEDGFIPSIPNGDHSPIEMRANFIPSSGGGNHSPIEMRAQLHVSRQTSIHNMKKPLFPCLAVNAGSSSVKCKLFKNNANVLFEKNIKQPNATSATKIILDAINQSRQKPKLIGHRVVHAGVHNTHAVVTKQIEQAIASAIPLA